jgi:hypothetical protein
MSARSRWCCPAVGLLAALAAVPTLSVAGPTPANATPAVFEAGAFPELLEAGVPVETAAVDAAIGDFNGDTHADVFVAMGRTQGAGGLEVARADRLYLGDGVGGFSLAATAFDAAAPRAAAGVVAADFNRDERLDLLVAGGSVYLGPTPGVRVDPSVLYSGRAGSVFDAGVTLAVAGSQPIVQVAGADMDGDGDVDVLLRASNGTLRLLRNVGAAGAAVEFQLAQEIPGAASDPRQRFAVGRFAGEDALPDVALLLPTNAAGVPGVQIWRNGGGALPLQLHGNVALPPPLADVAAADFNADGRDDLVVVADAEDPTPQWSRTRVLWATATDWRIGEERFPANGLRRVSAGDLDGDGRADLVFGRLREAGSAPRDVPSLLIALNRNGGFEPTAQCLGRYAGVPSAIRIGRLDADAWPDLLVMGAAPQVAPSTGPGWWRNHAANLAGACCMAELAAQHSATPTPPAALRAVLAAAAVDLRAYSAVRDQLFATAANGARLRQRFEQFSPEIAQRMRSEPALWGAVATTLSLWSEPLLRLQAGNGASRTVSAEMIEAVDTTLQQLSALGSPALAQAIAEERALLPPLDGLVGLDMNQFRAAVLPADRVYANGFEVTP